MIKSMVFKEKIKKMFSNRFFWVVFLLMVLGFFLRAYHFEDWMHYQLDQARDFRVVYAAIEYGPGELPLQGPRAAGSFLRLGPLFYYLEYLSALVFGATPAGSVMIILLLNVLAIPLFYFFLRNFFERMLAGGMTAIFSVSLFLVTYSRFGWNPTLVPFFVILFAQALFQSSKQGGKKVGWWLVVASVALAFLTNMHFLALVIAPTIGFLYLLVSRPKIKLKFWLGAMAIFLFLNLPLIVNDCKTKGENLKEFFEVSFNRAGAEKDDHNLLDKLVKNGNEHVQYYWLVLTGDQKAELPQLDGTDIQCRHDCRVGIFRGFLSLLLIGFACWAGVNIYRKEKDIEKKNFLRLIFIWGAVTFLLYWPLAYDLAPRFFLINAPLFFVLTGFLFQKIKEKGEKKGQLIFLLLISLFVLSNLFYVKRYFNELSRAGTDENFELNYGDKILKEKTRVTLIQMEEIVDWMQERYQKNNYPLFIHAQPELKRAFWERVDFRQIPNDSISQDLDPLYRKGNYFIIVRSQSDQQDFLKKFLLGLEIKEMKEVGTLTVYHFQPKEEYVTDEEKEFPLESRDPKFSKGVQPRYLWRQVFAGCTYNYKTDQCEK